jgi:hypothetical protein
LAAVNGINRNLETVCGIPELRFGQSFFCRRIAVSVRLHPALRLDRVTAKLFDYIFLATGTACFQSRQDAPMQFLPLLAED